MLLEVATEEGVETDSPVILFDEVKGKLNSDLTVGTDVTSLQSLQANAKLSLRGMTYMGAGFILDPNEAKYFISLGSIYESVIKPYLSGRDLVSRPRGVYAIDLFGWEIEDVRSRLPAIYQHLLMTVKPIRDRDNRATYRERWWIFAEPRQELRSSIKPLQRFIGTSQTAKHRIFQFLDSGWLPDQTLVIIATDSAYILGVISSTIHVSWAFRSGGWLGVGNDHRYSNTRTFGPFPFPDATDSQKAAIGDIAEELDIVRKRVLAQHPHLTLTGLYNVIERLRAGQEPGDLNEREHRIFDDGLVLIMKELHEKLDAAVADAYGWPVDLDEEEVLALLVGLNKERAKEEARGKVRWLRPEYQIPRFGSDMDKAEQLEADLGESILNAVLGQKPNFPKDERDQTFAVHQALMGADGPLEAEAIAAGFKQGRKCLPAVNSVLAALYRMGLVSTSDGRSFAFRRIA